MYKIEGVKMNAQGDNDKVVVISHNCDENVRIDADVTTIKPGFKLPSDVNFVINCLLSKMLWFKICPTKLFLK